MRMGERRRIHIHTYISHVRITCIQLSFIFPPPPKLSQRFSGARISPSRSSGPLCWTSWSEAGTASPWLRSPRRGSPGSTSRRRIRNQGYRIPRMSTCKSPELQRRKSVLKRKKRGGRRRARWSSVIRPRQSLGLTLT